MTKRVVVLFVSAVLAVVLWAAGCAEPGEEPGLSVRVGETEKTLPEGFYDLAESGLLVSRAQDDTSYEALWQEYRLSGSMETVDWDREAVLFLGIFESGSCPLHFESARLSEEEDNLIVRLALEDDSVPCTDDATPRTIVLVLDRDVVNGLQTVTLEDYHGSNPEVAFHQFDS